MSQKLINTFILQLDQNWNEEDWIVPLSVALEGLTPAQAAWKPAEGCSSIRQLVNHINYYNTRTLNRLRGETLVGNAATNDESFGDAGDPGDAEGWERTVRETESIYRSLRAEIAGLQDEALEAIGQSGMTLGDFLSIWIAHDGYHSGQIVLLRKMQGCWR
ncbi:DinB family protein [Paenibacillus sp. P96]|uniref:DinB family protein n=1 Tax=Paenibacillus zeirhizosphaerae TaxID=2987519 RepID=A0ABT9FUY9_9BACL|nr:DinB family protein [Paenibacillus sp. P96]MDP4098533.1 DinB family protein [Paenibacillus sp. P96]